MITNYLSPIEFELSITRIPNVEFFVQRASIPGISMQGAIQPTRFNNVYHSPDNLQFGEFNITFIVDERMRNWAEIFNWMNGLSFPRDHSEFIAQKEDDNGLYSDVRLLVKNSGKNPNVRFVFRDAFPINMSDIQLDTTQNDVIHPECSVSFQYDTFEFELEP